MKPPRACVRRLPPPADSGSQDESAAARRRRLSAARDSRGPPVRRPDRTTTVRRSRRRPACRPDRFSPPRLSPISRPFRSGGCPGPRPSQPTSPLFPRPFRTFRKERPAAPRACRRSRRSCRRHRRRSPQGPSRCPIGGRWIKACSFVSTSRKLTKPDRYPGCKRHQQKPDEGCSDVVGDRLQSFVRMHPVDRSSRIVADAQGWRTGLRPS